MTPTKISEMIISEMIFIRENINYDIYKYIGNDILNFRF